MCKHGTTVIVTLAHPREHRALIVAGVDKCIAELVQALNNMDMQTVASCCGHGHQPGRISLEDGREILIVGYDQATKISKLFPNIHGEIKHDKSK